jgi:hypothetical protein
MGESKFLEGKFIVLRNYAKMRIKFFQAMGQEHSHCYGVGMVTSTDRWHTGYLIYSGTKITLMANLCDVISGIGTGFGKIRPHRHWWLWSLMPLF